MVFPTSLQQRQRSLSGQHPLNEPTNQHTQLVVHSSTIIGGSIVGWEGSSIRKPIHHPRSEKCYFRKGELNRDKTSSRPAQATVPPSEQTEGFYQEGSVWLA